MNMEQHIRELKEMRQVCRDEGITDASLAEHFKCTVQSIFDILQGTTKEGELRSNLYTLLTTRELLAPFLGVKAPVPYGGKVFSEEELPTAIRDLLKERGVTQSDLGRSLGQQNGASISGLLAGRSTRSFLYRAADHLGLAFERDPSVTVRAGHRGKVKEVPAKPETKGAPELAPVPVRENKVAVPVPVSPSPAAAEPLTVNLDGNFETLMLQAAAAEELAESLKDLAVLRQAERRCATALKLCRAAGLNVELK